MKPDKAAILKSMTSMPKAPEGADSARPSYAVTMWSDDNWIYVELPCKGSIPYVTKFAFTEGGLGKALYVLRNARKNAKSSGEVKEGAKPGHIARISHPLLKKPVPKTTEEQRKQALGVLRKLKMLDK